MIRIYFYINKYIVKKMPLTHLLKVVPYYLGGFKVITTEAIEKGKIIYKLRGQIVEERTRTSIQSGTIHMEDDVGEFITHSCYPSVKVSHFPSYLYACRNIEKYEDITINYNTNEDEIAYPFDCDECGMRIDTNSMCEKKYLEYY